MIAIVDYGVGNLFSLFSSLSTLGQDAVVTGDRRVLADAQKLILPGVGAFCDAARALRLTGLHDAVLREAAKGKPLLGICLGMQMLFTKSYEYGLSLIHIYFKRGGCRFNGAAVFCFGSFCNERYRESGRCPVSYTHLDVYKRQGVVPVANGAAFGICLGESGIFRICKRFAHFFGYAAVIIGDG